MIKNDDFDLVLCDIKMPKMDGVEVLEAVKKIKPEIPMVMISGHGDLDTAVNTMRMGAFDYISKPPDLNRLLEYHSKCTGPQTIGGREYTSQAESQQTVRNGWQQPRN